MPKRNDPPRTGRAARPERSANTPTHKTVYQAQPGKGPAAPTAKNAPPTRPEGGVARGLRWRIWTMLGVFLSVWFIVLGYRLYVLQVRDFETYRSRAAAQQLKDTQLAPARGQIYDSEGRVLARSTIVWDITADPSQFEVEPVAGEDEAATARRLQYKIQAVSGELAELLDLNYDLIYERLSDTDSQYKVLARRVDKPLADTVREYARTVDAPISIVQTTRRDYPYGAFMASVLGFCNVDGDGFYGLEKYYDEALAGTPGRTLTLRNAWGNEVAGEDETVYPQIDGGNLVLTLNVDIQAVAEKYLEAAVKTHNVNERGIAIVMDVNTGAIRALAIKPDFDPNDPYTIYDPDLAARLEEVESSEEYNQLQGQLREYQWKNKAITDLYFPGSVFKLITTAAALDSGVCAPDTHFNCSGHFQVEDREYTCAGTLTRSTTAHGWQDMALGLRNSCNSYYIQVGQALGAQRFFDYFNAFGFTEPTGVDLPSEQRSILYYDADRLRPVELASSSFGQAQKVTPLQMLTAACAVVNGGYLVQPHIVSRIEDADGNVIQEMTPEIKRQVISEEISAAIRVMMEGVVDNGADGAPGRNAYVAGYNIGGKSGTSEKIDIPKDAEGNYEVASSFLAVVPANDPQIAVFVILDQPHSGENYGSLVSAPVVGNIISEIAPYLGLETDPATLVTGNVRVPDVAGQEWSMAQVELNKDGLYHRLVGGDGEVLHQYPAAGESVPAGCTVYLYTESEENSMTTVPGVVGKDAGFAVQMLAASSLNVQFVGPQTGTVTAQSAAEGTELPLGSVVTLTVVDETTPE